MECCSLCLDKKEKKVTTVILQPLWLWYMWTLITLLKIQSLGTKWDGHGDGHGSSLGGTLAFAFLTPHPFCLIISCHLLAAFPTGLCCQKSCLSGLHLDKNASFKESI